MMGVVAGILGLVLLASTVYALGVEHRWWTPPWWPEECRGDYPLEVPFRQGMTLCPGQRAILYLRPESGFDDEVKFPFPDVPVRQKL